MKKTLTSQDKFTVPAWITTALAAWIFVCAPAVSAQGSRKDDIVFGPAGHPVAGATVRVCQPAATGTPCSPLATIYTDATLTVPSANPFQSDGIGNYHFYAPAGRYMIQISGPTITGTITQPDAILAPDLSSTSGSNISAFGLTLGGNLSVAGNTNISGTLTTSSFSPGIFSPSSLSVLGSEKVQGPRPWIDVTAYGALGNGSGTYGHDDTAGIQSAINAACASSGVGSSVPVVFFPPGAYWVSQPQTPSTSPVFSLPCSIEIDGSGFYPAGSGFPVAAHGSAIIVQNKGASPNSAPVFYIQYPFGGFGGNFVMKNMTVDGGNQAMLVTGSMTVKLYDVCLANGLSGTDATPLKLVNTFWFYMDGGCLQSGGSTQPVALFTAEGPYASSPTSVFDVYIRNVLTTGGGFVYDQRTPVLDVGPGGFRFENITQEQPDTDGFTLLCTGGATYNFNGLTLDNVTQADSTDNTAAMVNMNCANSKITGLRMLHVAAGNAGQGVAARATAGTIVGFTSDDCVTQCVAGVVDSSGNPTGIGMMQSYAGGWDSVFDTTLSDRLRTDFVPGSIQSDSPSNRWFKKGTPIACLGIDPLSGWLFADCTNFGFNASLNETSIAKINVNFAAQLPPTGLSGTAASGGSIPSGTYTAVIRATPDNCTNESAPSAPSASVILSGSNNTINWTWTVPTAGTYTGSIAGYCLTLGSQYSNQYVFVSGASTASYSMTASPSAGGINQLVNALQAQHVFTAAGLGLNTTTPGPFNLDVQGALGARIGTVATPSQTAAGNFPSCLAAVSCGASLAISNVEADSFTRANASTLGTNWTAVTGHSNWQIVSNTAVDALAGFTIASWNAANQTFSPDQFSIVTLSAVSGGNGGGPAVRADTSGAFTLYYFYCSNTASQLTKVIAGTQTNLATSSTLVCAPGDVLELDIAGTHLTVLHNGTPWSAYSLDDSSITSGQPGVNDFTSSVQLTNWRGGNLAPVDGINSIFNHGNSWTQNQNFKSIGTLTNCSSSAAPAVCGTAAAGSVAIAAGATTVVVNTSAVTASSQIMPVFDESLGTKLGVTCNSASASEAAQYFISARSAGTSFTLKTSVAPTTNPACLSYTIQN